MRGGWMWLQWKRPTEESETENGGWAEFFSYCNERPVKEITCMPSVCLFDCLAFLDRQIEERSARRDKYHASSPVSPPPPSLVTLICYCCMTRHETYLFPPPVLSLLVFLREKPAVMTASYLSHVSVLCSTLHSWVLSNMLSKSAIPALIFTLHEPESQTLGLVS